MNSSLVSAAYRTITNKNLLSNLYFRTDLSKFEYDVNTKLKSDLIAEKNFSVSYRLFLITPE